MSDPMTNAEVEDVLASIRRLVSEDHRQPAFPAATGQEPESESDSAERLVLTPALRVAGSSDEIEESDRAEAVSDSGQPEPETGKLFDDEETVAPDDAMHWDEPEEAQGRADEDGEADQGFDADTAYEVHADAAIDTPEEVDASNEWHPAAADDFDYTYSTRRFEAGEDQANDSRNSACEFEDSAEPDDDEGHFGPEDVDAADGDRLAEDAEAEEHDDIYAYEDEDDEDLTDLELAEEQLSEAEFEDAEDGDDGELEPDEDGELAFSSSRGALEQYDDEAAMPEAVDVPEHDDRVTAAGTETTSSTKGEAKGAATAVSGTLGAKIAALESLIANRTDTYEPDEPDTGENAGTSVGTMAWESAEPEMPGKDGGIAASPDTETTDRSEGKAGLDGDTKPAREAVVTGKAPLTLNRDDVAQEEVAAADPDTSSLPTDQEQSTPQQQMRSPEPPSAETQEGASRSVEPPNFEQPVAEQPASTGAAAPAAYDERDFRVRDDLDSYEDIIDEEALRDLVSDIVRQELQGALGERITRNVRKLVRREIHRALAAQDLE